MEYVTKRVAGIRAATNDIAVRLRVRNGIVAEQ
jgi:hypothetical protein